MRAKVGAVPPSMSSIVKFKRMDNKSNAIEWFIQHPILLVLLLSIVSALGLLRHCYEFRKKHLVLRSRYDKSSISKTKQPVTFWANLIVYVTIEFIVFIAGVVIIGIGIIKRI